MGTLYVAGQRITAGSLNQYYGFADVSDTTVTAATQQNLSTPYTIPANEPAVGAAYEVLFGGGGTWGSTAQSLAFTLVIQGTASLANVSIAAGAFNTNAGFRFDGRTEVVFGATGVTGSVRTGLLVNLSETANAVGSFTAASQSFGTADANATSTTVDTTSSAQLIVKCAWGATTGAPTITNRHTIFRKVS